MKRKEYLKMERAVYDKFSNPLAKRQRQERKKADDIIKKMGVDGLFKRPSNPVSND